MVAKAKAIMVGTAEQFCLSCKKSIMNDKGAVIFECPKCSGYSIVRCKNCRQKAVKYNCPACEFSGPN